MSLSKENLHQGQINILFLQSIDDETRNEIISSIARHYGTSNEEIIDEVSNEEAHCLLEYMVLPYRDATYLLMKAKGFK